ncbi:MAG TPA: ABC transporter permease subunit [Longimicrobium sp.]|nr:ABC transporter permease subunit [Longimicrobium sp.]
MSLVMERALASMTVRQILARRRAVALILFGLLPVALAAILRRRATTAEAALEAVVELDTMLIIPVILPIVALVIGTGVFGAEIDDGTAMYVLAKPVPRWRIVLTRVLVAAVATALLTAPAAFLVVPVLGAKGAATVGLGFAGAVAVGALLYSALFVALSLATRRALVAGIAYVVLWEGTIASRAAGTRYLSVRQFVLSLADRWAALPDAVFNAPLALRGAVVMSVLLCVGATAYAIRRLRRFEVGEAV